MEPIAYAARLNEFYRRQGFPAYQWTINESAPLTPLKKPLAGCRVAMLTSGGVSRKDAPCFNPRVGEQFAMNLGSGYRAKTA